MAEILSIISIVCFALAAVCFIAGIALYFAFNTKAAYLELKGRPQLSAPSVKNKKKNVSPEVPTSKMNVEDEAVTTLDNGEIATEISLMNVYEPGTELMDEGRTEVETVPIGNDVSEDEKTTEFMQTVGSKDFIITKRKILIHSDEILR